MFRPSVLYFLNISVTSENPLLKRGKLPAVLLDKLEVLMFIEWLLKGFEKLTLI
jgi:hypothetical protein